MRRAGVGGQRRVQEQRSRIREHGTLREWDTEVKQSRICMACNRERKRRMYRGGGGKTVAEIRDKRGRKG